jgi:4-hydroxy-tetrahydrodipicolinate synthase
MRDFSTIATPLRGIIPPIVTPLLDPETLDTDGLQSLIERLIAGRVHGIFALGSTGESPSLSLEVRREVIQQTCAAVAGRVPVLINVSENSFVHARLLAEYSAKAGASAVVWSPPCYFPVPQEDVERNAAAFAERSPLPLFLYNVPQYAHNEIAPDTVGRLSHVPNIVGLKNSNGSLDYLAAMKRRCFPRCVRGPEAVCAAEPICSPNSMSAFLKTGRTACTPKPNRSTTLSSAWPTRSIALAPRKQAICAA